MEFYLLRTVILLIPLVFGNILYRRHQQKTALERHQTTFRNLYLILERESGEGSDIQVRLRKDGDEMVLDLSIGDREESYQGKITGTSGPLYRRSQALTSDQPLYMAQASLDEPGGEIRLTLYLIEGHSLRARWGGRYHLAPGQAVWTLEMHDIRPAAGQENILRFHAPLERPLTLHRLPGAGGSPIRGVQSRRGTLPIPLLQESIAPLRPSP